MILEGRFMGIDQEYKNYLYILIILAALTISSLLYYFIGNETNFSTNLFSEFLSIIITVLILDWYFKRHEEKKWEGTDIRISKKLEKLLIIYNKILRNHFKLSVPSSYEEMLEQSQKILLELEKVQSIADEDWDVIMEKMVTFDNQLNKIIMSFESRLNYTQHELIMDIEENLEKLEKNYSASKKLRRDLFSKVNEEFNELMIEEMASILRNLMELDKTRKYPANYGDQYDK